MAQDLNDDVVQVQNNIRMYLDKSDTLSLKQNGYFEQETTDLIQSLLKPDDVCLDIGAHIGYFSLIMGKLCKEVVAYEPELNNFHILRNNIKLNKLDNIIIPIRRAVTDKEEDDTITLCRHESNTGMNRIYCVNWCRQDHEEVKTTCIDKIYNGTKVDFIKMDCEGSEYGALKGMKNLLSNDNNDIKLIMEFHPPSIREYGADPKEVYKFMTDLGYDIQLIGKYSNADLSYREIETITSAPIGGYNLFCEKIKR